MGLGMIERELGGVSLSGGIQKGARHHFHPHNPPYLLLYIL